MYPARESQHVAINFTSGGQMLKLNSPKSNYLRVPVTHICTMLHKFLVDSCVCSESIHPVVTRLETLTQCVAWSHFVVQRAFWQYDLLYWAF